MPALSPETIAAFARSSAPLPPTILTAGKTPSEYILALCRSFPSLHCKIEGITSFDSYDFFKRLKGCSTGQWHAGMFILNVWDPGNAEQEKWKFDFFTAFPSWDNSHRKAFLSWCANPQWP